MKRYIIRNADGSEQNEMQAVYESCEEALQYSPVTSYYIQVYWSASV